MEGTIVRRLCMLLLLLVVTSAAYAQDKPNIVLIFADNFGYGELGSYGGGITRGAPTPRLDALAREGTRLTNFNVEPSCTPSRSALMVGRHPIRDGTYSVPVDGKPYGLVQWEITIAKAARLCDRPLRQVAPRRQRGSLSERPGL
jgi:arylsulfatase